MSVFNEDVFEAHLLKQFANVIGSIIIDVTKGDFDLSVSFVVIVRHHILHEHSG